MMKNYRLYNLATDHFVYYPNQFTGGHPLQLDQVEHLYYYYLHSLSNRLFKWTINAINRPRKHAIGLLTRHGNRMLTRVLVSQNVAHHRK